MTTKPPTSPTHRKTLNTHQLQILYLLYKFRFGTSDLLAQCQHISRRYMNVRLGILVEQKFIGRNFNTSYKLKNKHASYYLLPEGIKLLKEQPDFNPKVLRVMAKDKNASERFITHSLGIFNVYCQLKQSYGDDVKFFTKSYLKLPKFEYFPDLLPDAYLSFKDNNTKHYLLESFEASLPFFVIRNRIDYLLRYADEGDWPEQHTFPGVLLICETEKLRQRVEAYAIQALEASWVTEILIATSTHREVAGDIWRRIGKPGERFSLRSLSLSP